MAHRALDGDLRDEIAMTREASDTQRRLILIDPDNIPSWQKAAGGPRPPQLTEDSEAGFDRGWQRFASSLLEPIYFEDAIKPICSSTQLALLLSQSSSDASAFLRAIPSERIFTIRQTSSI